MDGDPVQSWQCTELEIKKCYSFHHYLEVRSSSARVRSGEVMRRLRSSPLDRCTLEEKEVCHRCGFAPAGALAPHRREHIEMMQTTSRKHSIILRFSFLSVFGWFIVGRWLSITLKMASEQSYFLLEETHPFSLAFFFTLVTGWPVKLYFRCRVLVRFEVYSLETKAEVYRCIYNVVSRRWNALLDTRLTLIYCNSVNIP